jgi:putative spermidine/putrescine transport system ATP-binding protein
MPSSRGTDSTSTEDAPAITLEGIGKSYGEARILDDVSLEVREGEFFTLLGPSGSGKTTILRIVAGLVAPDTGSVSIRGEGVEGKAAHERDLAVVFQSLALFPHLTVAENVAFPLRMRRVQRKESARRVTGALSLVQLPGVEERRVGELSGGQRQRVALARALVYDPAILLLDEPLSALDRRLREDMQLELLRIHSELGVTIVNVTHDQREALMVSDRIALMEEGRVVQCGPGPELYDKPATAFVAGFLGDPLLLEGEVVDGPDGRLLRAPGIELRVGAGAPLGPGAAVLRPERLRLVAGDAAAGYDNLLAGSVEIASFDGTGTFYRVALDCGASAAVHVPAREDGTPFATDDRVSICWNVDEVPVVGEGR